MCCDTTLCSASGIDVGSPMTRGTHACGTAHRNAGSTNGTTRQCSVNGVASWWPAVRNEENESVRHCARRSGSHFDVAQASPLFSDHAPREVHLWQ
jgi:hypothetical protein